MQGSKVVNTGCTALDLQPVQIQIIPCKVSHPCWCSTYLFLAQESQCAANGEIKRNPRVMLSPQNLPTSCPRLPSMWCCTVRNQLLPYPGSGTHTPHWAGPGCHNQSTAAFTRTKKTSSTTQNLVVANLNNTIASSQQFFSCLQCQAGHYEKLLMLVFNNPSLSFPFRKLCTVIQVLLTPAHRRVHERRGFNCAAHGFEFFFSLPCWATELQRFPSCWRYLHTLNSNLLSPENKENTKTSQLSFAKII